MEVCQFIMNELVARQRLIIVLIVAFSLRIAVSLLPVVPISDCGWYHDAAVALSDGEGFSIHSAHTAYRMPGYSFTISLLYRILGKNPLWGRMLNALFGTISVWLLWNLARTICTPAKANTAAIVLALYPEHILFSNVITGEVIFTMLLLLWLVVMNKVQKLRWLHSGILIGTMSYIRAIALPLALLPILWNRKKYKEHIVAFILSAIILCPWVYRNYRTMGAPVLATNFWVNLWIGNGSKADGGYFDTEDMLIADEVQLEQYYRSALFSDIAKKPFRPLVLLPMKLAHFTLPSFTAPYWGLADVVKHSAQKWIAILLSVINIALVGVFILAIVRKKIPLQLWLIALYFTAIALVFFGSGRYRFPLLPMMICGATNFFEKHSRNNNSNIGERL